MINKKKIHDNSRLFVLVVRLTVRYFSSVQRCSQVQPPETSIRSIRSLRSSPGSHHVRLWLSPVRDSQTARVSPDRILHPQAGLALPVRPLPPALLLRELHLRDEHRQWRQQLHQPGGGAAGLSLHPGRLHRRPAERRAVSQLRRGNLLQQWQWRLCSHAH